MTKEGQWEVLGGPRRSTSRSSDEDEDEESEVADRVRARKRPMVWFGAASAATQALWARLHKPLLGLSRRPACNQVAIKLVPTHSREMVALDAMAGVRCW